LRLSKLASFPYLEGFVRRASILCHRHADVDAYCSAYATASLLKYLYPRCSVETAAPQGLNTLAKKVQETYHMKIVQNPNLRKADLVVVVDTAHILLLDDWVDNMRDSTCKKIFIDHHPPHKSVEVLADHLILNRKASSTCEVVYEIFEAKSVKMTKKTAQIIMTGILCDSQHLNIAGCTTLSIISRLCTMGASLDEARRVLSLKRTVPENMARLKAAQRSTIYRSGKWIIASTTVGSFHASAARALIDLGAHLSIAVGEKKEEMKGSLRSTQEFFKDSQIHLGIDIAEKVAEILNGAGGGHPGAASFTGIGSSEKALAIIMDLLSEKLHFGLQRIN
jgi:phosphoesterase RecJ-like protein